MKKCEATDANSDLVSARCFPLPVSEKPLSDEEWAKDLAYTRVSDPDDANFHTESILLGLAEGRKREREEAFTDAKALQIILEREEAAAMNMAEMLLAKMPFQEYLNRDIRYQMLQAAVQAWKERFR